MPQKKSSLMTSDSSDDNENCDQPKMKRVKLDKNSDEYLERRQRNNLAVRKSREKSRAKAKETMAQVTKLRAENEVLEQKVQLLSKELSVLKDLFLAHAGPVSDAPHQTVTVSLCDDHQYSATLKEEK